MNFQKTVYRYSRASGPQTFDRRSGTGSFFGSLPQASGECEKRVSHKLVTV